MNLIQLLLLLLLSSTAHAFNDSECLKGDFKTSVEKGIDPFGYLKEVLTITKAKCDITIEVSKAKYLRTKWHIDICREPIHIKFGKSLQDVTKKITTTCNQRENDYCEIYSDIKTVLEDKGLIYGKGVRENLNSQHGKVYCSYLLINQYLGNNVVFSFERPIEVALTGPTFMNGLASKVEQDKNEIIKSDENNIETNSDKLYDF